MNYYIERKIINEMSFNKSQSSSSQSFNEFILDYETSLSTIVYNIYIDLNDMIFSIMNTKYHSNEELNSVFQKNAINYIMNRNSSFALFIYELFYLYNKALIEKSGENNLSEIIKNKDIFTVKVKEGKKYTKDDFNLLKKKREETVKKIEEEKIQKEKENNPVIKELKHGKKVQYKLCKFDIDVNYDNIFFPFKSVYYINGKEFKPQDFNKMDRSIFKYNKTISNFINVYDLIFTVKYIDNNNIIILEKNDISEILKPYSEKEIFYSLLKQNFSCESQDDENIDVTPIKEYLKNKKLIE